MAKLLSLFRDEDDAPKASSCDMCGSDHGIDEDCNMEEGWANSPDGYEGDPDYRDHQFMVKDIAGGINREKKMYKASVRGDNPSAVKESTDSLESRIRAELTALYKL